MPSIQEVPRYYSSDFQRSAAQTLSDPERKVQELNEEILKLHPKRELIKAVCQIVFAILLIGVSIVFAGSKPPYSWLLLLVNTLLSVGLGIDAIQSYRQFRSECSKTTKRISELPKGQFSYLDRIYSDGQLSIEEFNQIKRHLQHDSITQTSVHLPIRRERCYKILGGEISAFSTDLIHLELIQTTDNQNLVFQT